MPGTKLEALLRGERGRSCQSFAELYFDKSLLLVEGNSFVSARLLPGNTEESSWDCIQPDLGIPPHFIILENGNSLYYVNTQFS